ncbi:NfeD family protein [Cognatazoarcus halotolerans]|uniref:NfeD family protein n=1 Tax=Cognatazoarcus halotolerans TaxID=2686016 RepID=UPI00135AC3EE|nr:nodulation protein NfeD [Cognatazoarcus halotolerans]MCP5307863.1 nodulation protein NfeD [Zoogloeaceae bacterium]
MFRTAAGLLLTIALTLGAATTALAGSVVSLRLDGIIEPASADFIVRGLERASAGGAELVVIEMDTPGGLDTAMRQIIKAILASPVPVATFVHPEGARAASAGTYILYASHIAAMSPATNLGAATPVAIGMPGGGARDKPPAGEPADEAADAPGAANDKASTPTAAPPIGDAMMHKATNDAAAYLKSLAEMRGRNVEFAERAVREAASISAMEAKREGVIDFIATDLRDLLAQADGRVVSTSAGERTLHTRDAQLQVVEPDWRSRTLAVLANPQLAVILMMIGVYGLFVEFTSPGFGVPGVAGAICLTLALFAFQMLPINWAGVALIGLGAALMIAEVFVPSFGALGVGGIVAFVLGGLFLVDSEIPGLGIPLPFLVGTALVSAGLIFAVGTIALRERKRAVVTGREEMPGSVGVITLVDGDGARALVHGESWQVHASSALAPGQKIRVTRIDGLTLEVEPVDSRPATGARHDAL